MPWLPSVGRRRTIAVYVAVIATMLALMALLGTGPVVLAPGPAP